MVLQCQILSDMLRNENSSMTEKAGVYVCKKFENGRTSTNFGKYCKIQALSCNCII